MSRRILLLGLRGVVVEEALDQLDLSDVELLGGTGIDDLRAAFDAGPLDVVIMGAGLDLDVRLDVVREVFTRSDTTSVHLKDRASGPEGFLPFVRSILR